MALAGKYNRLVIKRIVNIGAYLEGKDSGEILLPAKYLPKDSKLNDLVDVFVYFDSEDRLIATTEKPFAQVGEFAFLKVKVTNKYGAFLDWGLSKDLLLPHSNQKETMKKGHKYLVYIYLDPVSRRIVASTKHDKFLGNIIPAYKVGDEVEIIIAQKTEIGYKAIINHLHWGVLYQNEVFQPLKTGDKMNAFVRKIREDEKIDLTLIKDGYDKINEVAEKILSLLDLNQGFLQVNDKSAPEEIYRLFGISKKNFKMAIGNLYRRKLIDLKVDGIQRINSQ